MSIRDAHRALIFGAAALAACSSEYADAGFQITDGASAGSAGGRPAAAAQPAAGSSAVTRPTADSKSPPPTRAAESGDAVGAGSSARVAASGGVGAAAIGSGGAGATASSAGAGGAGAPAVNGAGTGGAAGTITGTEPTVAGGECCDDGDCLCHGPAPSELSAGAGPFKTERTTISSGTLHYPADAEPPFAAVALCGGFLNTGPEMESWGPMYASHGIVTVIVTTDGADIPDIRAARLLAAIDELKELNMDNASPLGGKLSGRYGTSGYSMGGGGTALAAGQNTELKTSVGLAPWGGSGNGVRAATLLLCGDADTVAPCNMAESLYAGIADSTPKMLITISGSTHFDWFGPADAGRGTSGSYALAFQKVFLEGDTRWKPLLLKRPSTGSFETNID